jgi:glycosyltransferase involved in cell wall biosynthesis
VKFSIVITTYNRVEFLKRAIACSLNQTVPCEVVVVDDASTDDTENYVRSLGDQVVYHRNAQNLNHAGSVNAGVNVATGDWIKFLDDDDYLDPTCIEKMQAAIARHPQAVICSCQAIQVNQAGQELKRTQGFGTAEAYYIPQEAIHYAMLLDLCPFGTPVQVAVQRVAFLKTRGWDTRMTTNYDDIDAWVRIAEYGDALFLNDYLAYRTLWEGGFEQRKTLQYRLNLNISIKQRIYQRISAAYQAQCPDLSTIESYLHLHWGLVALKQRKWLTTAALSFPAALNPQAWQLLKQIRQERQQPSSQFLIPRTPLS